MVVPPVTVCMYVYMYMYMCVYMYMYNVMPFSGLGLPEQAMGWLPLRLGIGNRK
jgi:hypothetical protein